MENSDSDAELRKKLIEELNGGLRTSDDFSLSDILADNLDEIRVALQRIARALERYNDKHE